MHSLTEVTPLRWRNARPEDLGEVYSLLSAVAAFDDTPCRWTPEDLPEWYAGAGELASEFMVLGFEGASLVSVGWNINGEIPDTVRIDGAVHPAFRHQGIGRSLVAWQLDRARDWFLAWGQGSTVRIVAFSDAAMSNKRSLFTHQGLTPTRWLIDMVCQFPAPGSVADFVVTPVLGIHFVEFGPEWVEPTRQAHNEAFAFRWGSREVSPDDWAASLRADHARPDLSWVAVDDWGTVMGYALNSATWEFDGPRLGWTDRLGVRPAQRGRNIARILLARSLDAFRRAGMDAGGVGMDSVDGGGTPLYQSLGYRATDTIIQFERSESRDAALAALKR